MLDASLCESSGGCAVVIFFFINKDNDLTFRACAEITTGSVIATEQKFLYFLSFYFYCVLAKPIHEVTQPQEMILLEVL
jgi:hypothetical protein